MANIALVFSCSVDKRLRSSSVSGLAGGSGPLGSVADLGRPSVSTATLVTGGLDDESPCVPKDFKTLATIVN